MPNPEPLEIVKKVDMQIQTTPVQESKPPLHRPLARQKGVVQVLLTPQPRGSLSELTLQERGEIVEKYLSDRLKAIGSKILNKITE